jgi:hypothetical protein
MEETFTIFRVPSPGFDITWAGRNPWAQGLCFGSADGRIRFRGFEGVPDAGPFDVAPSREAVNGVAFARDLMAISTRDEVVFFNVPLPETGVVERAIYYGGAYDVVTTPAGGFMAPMGVNGLLLLKEKQADRQTVSTLAASAERFNIYKVAGLALQPGGKEVIACAGRRDGFAILTLGTDYSVVAGRRLRSPGVDFIDVCSLRSQSRPLAAAALGLDCSIHLTTDALTDPSPKSVRFSAIKGRGYRIFCVGGNIIVLTSQGLYILRSLASRFLEGQRVGGMTEAKWLEFKAADAFLVADDTLFLMLPDGLYALNLAILQPDEHAPASEAGEELAIEPASRSSMVSEVEEESWEMYESPRWRTSRKVELVGV